ncbi:MAG: HD-GYP domain-containing protein [Candidatus Dormibacteraeota bacterium]|nr:HD-GYP domain-containing protein [Candidatus Dormibacteraeota bacterium]
MPRAASERPSGAVVGVVGLVCLAAVTTAALLVRPPFDFVDLALVVVFVTVLDLRGPVGIPIGRGRVSFSGTAYAGIASVFLLGPSAAVAVAIALVATETWNRRHSVLKKSFNAAMSLLLFSAAALSYEAVSGRSSAVPVIVAAGAAGGLGGWLVNHALVAAVLRAEQGRSGFQVRPFLHQVLAVLPYYVGYGLTGVGIVAASSRLGAAGALVVLAAPVTIVQIATTRWMKEQAARLADAESAFNATLISLSKAIDLRDKDTEGHCRRVVEYSLLMGRNLKFSQEEMVRLSHGALLHDIGKIGVPDAILMKPGPLTEEEWAIMRTHPELGFQMVSDVRQLERAREIILNHHERFDGKGYPRGLRGDAIPLPARVFSIADSFDAMISDRPYRKGMPLEEARAEVRRCSGTQFDPICVAAFDQIPDEELRRITEEREHPTEELLSLFA